MVSCVNSYEEQTTHYLNEKMKVAINFPSSLSDFQSIWITQENLAYGLHKSLLTTY